jgi:phosphoglycerol transferase
MSSSPSASHTSLRRRVASAVGIGSLLAVVATCWFLHRYFGMLTLGQVLYHLENGGLDQADPTLWWRAARYALITLLVLGLAFWAWLRLGRRGRGALWAFLATGAVVSVGATLHDPCDPSGGDLVEQAYVDPATQQMRVPAPAERPDALIVFVEALDEAYAHPRPATAPLLPQLTAWRRPADQLGELDMLEGAHWTMGGLFAALCGLHLQPVGLISRGDYAHAGPFFAGGTCLTDLLAAQGWQVSFYGGASLAFAGKGEFMARHGAARRFGREEWAARGVAMPKEGWGPLDAALTEQVWADIAHDDAPGRPPRADLVLTVNTHVPAGAADPGCGDTADPARDADQLRQALRCTDRVVAQLVQRFLARADGRPKVVWLMGDHVTPRPLLADELASPTPPQAVFHALARTDGQGRDWPQPQPAPLADAGRPGRLFAHVDVLPTLAEALGLSWAPQAHRLGLGVSLLAPAAGPTWIERLGHEPLQRRLACPSARFQQLWRGQG